MIYEGMLAELDNIISKEIERKNMDRQEEFQKLREADAASKKADFEFKVGDVVEYMGEDSYYKGTIVCIFTKLNGRSVRAIVENDDGLLLIKGLSNAKLYILGPNHEQPKAE